MFWPIWWSNLAVTAFLLFLASNYSRFPGDLETTRALQALDSSSHTWANWLTNTAKAPWSYGILALTAFLGWRLAGWRALLVAPAAYGLALGADRLLKPWIARPRPSPLLVDVAGSSVGSSCPSTFGLVYASTVGLVVWLAISRGTGRVRWWTLTIGALLLVLGGAARVVLGGHWPSDLALSFLAGALIVTALSKFILRP